MTKISHPIRIALDRLFLLLFFPPKAKERRTIKPITGMHVRIKYQNTPAVESGLYSLDKTGFVSPLAVGFTGGCPYDTSLCSTAGVRADTGAAGTGVTAAGAAGTEGAGAALTAAGVTGTGSVGAGSVLTPDGTEVISDDNFSSWR